MQLANSTTRYGAVPQLIHWLTALFVIAGWSLGQFGYYLPAWADAPGFFVHMTLGESVIALLIIRLAWRVADPPPPIEPTPFGWWVKAAAHLGHFALYALLLIVPFLGIVVQLKRGHQLPVFGLFDFASPWPADRPLARSVLAVHYYLANTLMILAGVHAAAALVHHWVWHDRTLVRMLPGAPRN
jgi:cytochrome b561